MHPNAERLQAFYAAFAALQAEPMQAAYAPDAVFRDEVFQLDGAASIGAMWRMLCEGARERGLADWRLDASGIAADAQQGRAHWEAHYRFGPAGRRVHNRIEARFEFRDGLIVCNVDSYPF